jgi:dihydrofolate reductase
MGRKTYESIGGTLPKRQNIIVSSTLKTNTAHVVDSLPGALAAATQEKIFLIGGEQIFKEGLEYATHMLLTLIHDHVQGDAYFPDFEETSWNVISHEWIESYSVLSLRKRTQEQVLQQASQLQ